MKRNRGQPQQKLLPSLTRYNREWHDVNTHVRLGELEDVIARPGEDPQDLVTCIKTLMDHCKMINDEHWEHVLHRSIVCAYCHEGKLLDKLMAKPFKTPSSELTDITVNHFAIQHTQEQVYHSSKPVEAICHDKPQGACTSHDGDGHTLPTPSRDCPNCTWQHPASRTNCPTRDSRCSKSNKIGHWGPKCHGGKPPQPKNAPSPRNASPTRSQCGKSRCPPGSYSHQPGRGGKTDAIDVVKDHSPKDEIVLYGIQANVTTIVNTCTTVNTKEVPIYDELFTDAINYGTAGHTHPEEIVVDDVHTSQCNEAYTMVKLPASASSKGTPSLCIEVNTGAGGHMLPLHVFKHLYPDWISPAGLPTGLDHISTRLTAYNGSHIPLYGALCGPITWQPGHPGTQPHWVNSYWHVTDSPDPAILGLPSCVRLAVGKMNCAITVAQPDTKTPNPAPAPTVTAPKPIRTTDHLMKKFPDQFTEIGRFPGKYTIQLHHKCSSDDTHPQEMPQCLASKGQGTPWQDGMLRSDHPCRQTHGLGVLNHLCPEGKWQATPVFGSLWPQQGQLPWSPQDAHCGGSHPQVHALLLLHQAGCPSWILVNHSWSGLQPSHNLQQSLQQIPFPASSLWPCLLSRHLPEEDGPDPRGVARMHWDHRWHHCPWLHLSRTWCPSTEPHVGCLQIWVSVQPTKTYVKAPVVNFFSCLYDADGVHPDPNKVNTIHALWAPTNITKLQEFLGMVIYLSPFIWGLSTLTAPWHELLNKDADFTWNWNQITSP